jgi:hypothetical protein
MGDFMKGVAVLVALLAAVVSVPYGPADAAFLLTNANVAPLGGIVITVTQSTTANGTLGCANLAGCVTLSVQLTSSPVTNMPLGIDKFGFNAAGVDIIGPVSWLPDSHGNEDGFGHFTDTVDKPAAREGISSPIVFTLNTSTVTFTPNDVTRHAMFAAHVRYSGGCSGFVSDGAHAVPLDSSTGCTPVPEPITMALGATGLLAMGYAARKYLSGLGRLAA